MPKKVLSEPMADNSRTGGSGGLPPLLPGKRGWPWTVPEDSAVSSCGTEGGGGWPKISIVTPNYNYGRFIEQTIRSVLLQDYPNLEYIIIDDGSTDDSVEIIKKYGHCLSFWKTGPNRGQTQAINAGLRLTTGEIITWLNSDDLFEPGALFEIGRCFREQRDAMVIFGDCRGIDESGDEECFFKGRTFTREELIRRWDRVYHDFWIVQPSVFFRRTLLDEFGYLNEKNQSCMDYEFWLKVNQRYNFVHVGKTLSDSRSHDAARSIKFRKRQFQESIAASRKYWHENYLRYYLSYYFYAFIKYPAWKSFKRLSRRMRHLVGFRAT